MRPAILHMIARVLCLSGCAVLCAAQVSSRKVWLDVPFVKQSKKGCGSACLSMVMQYWDSKTHQRSVPRESEQAIYRKLYSSQAGGISATAMKQYLEGQGFLVYAFEGNWEDLLHHLTRGRPLIVCLKHGATRHYTVVSGMDADRDIVATNDPDGKKLQKMSRTEFERAWKGSDNWTLMALP